MRAAEFPQTPRPAVGAVVFNQGRVLLVRRAKDPAAGTWAIPGGRVRLGETLQQAAEREVFEETGLTVIAGAPVYTFDVIERDPTGRVRFHYVIVDLAATYVAGDLKAGDDALEAGWFGPDQWPRIAINPSTLRFLKSLSD